METILPLARAALGIAALLGLCWAVSENRRAVDWRLVGAGMALQIALAILIRKVELFRAAIEAAAAFFAKLIGFSNVGAATLFGSMPEDAGVFGMAFSVLPTIIFFSAFSAVLYHLRILQCLVYGFAWLMAKTLRLSGAECLAAAANVFVGQTEAPLVVKPYLKGMSPSELNCLMTGGMATIAGGVLAIYMARLGGGAEAATIAFGEMLLTASILSAPAALVAAKIIAPQTREVDTRVAFPREAQAESLLDA